jgi:hypothetical protein
MARWPTLVASDKTIQEAKQDERPGDGWIEAVCEAALGRWFTMQKISDYKWLRDNPRYAPDFFISGFRCDVIVLRDNEPIHDDTVIELAKARTLVSRAKEYYLFASYQPKERRVWLVGGISHARFLKWAKLDVDSGVYRLPVGQLSSLQDFLYETQVRRMFNAVEVLDTIAGVPYNKKAAPRDLWETGSAGTLRVVA